MATKQEMIAEMLEMQAKFIKHEQDGNFDAEEYYVGEWKTYRQRYQELTNQVRDIASEEANFWK